MDEQSETDTDFTRMLGEPREVFLARVLLSLLERLCAKQHDAWLLMLYDGVKHDVETTIRSSGRSRPGGRF